MSRRDSCNRRACSRRGSRHRTTSCRSRPFRLAPLNIPAGTNGAACPSEVPKVVVDGIGRSGAYLSIREWIPGQGLYSAEPRPANVADLHWEKGCALPDGMTVSIATFRDGHRDFTVDDRARARRGRGSYHDLRDA